MSAGPQRKSQQTQNERAYTRTYARENKATIGTLTQAECRVRRSNVRTSVSGLGGHDRADEGSSFPSVLEPQRNGSRRYGDIVGVAHRGFYHPLRPAPGANDADRNERWRWSSMSAGDNANRSTSGASQPARAIQRAHTAGRTPVGTRRGGGGSGHLADALASEARVPRDQRRRRCGGARWLHRTKRRLESARADLACTDVWLVETTQKGVIR